MRRIDRARRPGKSRVAILCHQSLQSKGEGSVLRLRLSVPEYLYVRPGLPPVFVSVLKTADSPLPTSEMLMIREMLRADLGCWCYDHHLGYRRLGLSGPADDVVILPQEKREEIGEEGKGVVCSE